MRMPWSRPTSRQTPPPAFALQPLEPRIVMDGTPDDASNPVVEIQTSYGNIYIELFPDVAPATVENFLGYVERGDYDNTFFHRHVRDFVLQGGGYVFDEDRQDVDHIEQQDPVDNEFELSNVEWTVAMAKLGNDPDSATSEWFINLDDNRHNIVNGEDIGLDVQNGGFTVFGEVVGGRDVVATITGLRVANLGGSFSTVPVTESFDSQGDELHDEDLVVLHDVNLVYEPDESLVTDPDAIPGGSVNGFNKTTVVLPNGLGRAIAFQQDTLAGGWTVVELGLKSETANPGTSPVSWIDPKDGRTYAAAISSDGLIIYKNTEGTSWTSRNLNDTLTQVEKIASNITVFVGRGGAVYIAGLTANDEIMIYNQTGGSTNGEYDWTARNLSDTDLAAQGMATPVFVSPLSSYVTSWNALNVVGLDANGDIQAIWWAPGLDRWRTDNLSDLTGAPPMEGTIAPYLTSWGAINLTGSDANGNVVVTWWTPNVPWNTSNLTDMFDGPTLAPGSVSTYVTPWGATNIIGTDVAGNVIAYWWAPDSGPWNISNLSEIIEGAEIPDGPMIGVTSSTGLTSIFGSTDAGELIRYWWRPNDTWHWENVSDEAELV
ncbi:MAG TPA: peptidylprolyl isomerase [Phycisphaerales bacterium]|nr:peptidylprolyl isomerase [Phycisphaerales bacterium]